MNEIEKNLILRTMDSVDNLAIQVAELNTTLKENVLRDIELLKSSNTRHREELNDKERRLKKLEQHDKYVIWVLGFIGTIITSIVVPIIVALI